MPNMPRLAHGLLLLSVVLGVAALAPIARADEMDPTLHRLGIMSPTDFRPCSADGIALRTAGTQCAPDNATYQRIVLQLGNAVASVGLSPARTIGYRHFYVGMEVATTHIAGANSTTPPDFNTGTSDEFADWRADNYFRIGTEGRPLADPSSVTESTIRYEQGNRFTNSNLTLARVAFRKGLPLGLELGGSAGHILQTNMWAFTFEVKWALFEGFRHRWPAAFPDLSVRASVTSLAGIRGFSLTVPTFDARISKSIVIGSTVTLTPYVGGQLVWIMADSEVIDVTPGNVADNAGDASLVVFDRIREFHPRILAGLELRYTRFVMNGAFRYDIMDPARNFSAARNMPKQWTVDIGVGVVY